MWSFIVSSVIFALYISVGFVILHLTFYLVVGLISLICMGTGWVIDKVKGKERK